MKSLTHEEMVFFDRKKENICRSVKMLAGITTNSLAKHGVLALSSRG